ncbi:MAG: hypothetical protein WD757_06415 [Actinomycetota bacterium]
MRSLSRREFLRSSAAAAAGLSLGGSLLAACSPTRPKPRTSSIPLVRKENPVTWPIYGDNPPIASGLEIEKGATLKVYQWREYLYEDVLESFAKKFDVSYEVKNYETIQEGVAGIRGAQRDFDVFFPTVEVLGELVQSKELRPLNHEYLPNLGNLWTSFTRRGAPFYDLGQRYSVPYTVYGTGILIRDELASIPPEQPFANGPYDVFWRYKNGAAVLNEYREAIGMALLRNGAADINTNDVGSLRRATDDLIRLGPRLVTPEAAYYGLPAGIDVAQSWSGDVYSSPRVGKSSHSPPYFFWPSDGDGIVGNDLTSILPGGSNPVLAHAFVNYLLDSNVAVENFMWNGYQPPLKGIGETPALLKCEQPWVECPYHATLNGDEVRMHGPFERSELITPEQFERSQMLLPLDPETDALWQSEWQRFLQHAEKA